jgi:HK97 family phage major capsid protein
MKESQLLTALRIAKRRKIIHAAFGPRGNAGPLGATVAFESDGDDGTTAVLGDDEFKTEVLDGLKAQDTRIKSMEAKQAEVLKAMPKELKTLLEDLTKLQRHANDTQANFNAATKKIEKIQATLQNEARRGWESPIERIERDEELRTRLNIAVRLTLSHTGEMLSPKMVERAKELTGLDLIELKARDEQRHNRSILGKTLLGEDTSPGSTLIDDRLSREIYDTLSMFGIWNTFQVVPVGTMTTKFPVTTTRPTANFIMTEGAAITEGAFIGTSVSCIVEAIAAIIPVSLQLLEDSEYDVTSYVMQHFGEAYANRLDHACLEATGAADATNGAMTGVFVGGTAAAAAGGNFNIELLDIEDYMRCLTTVDPIVLKRPAKWWTHPQHIVRALATKDGNGRPIFLNALEAPSPGAIGSILGYPVIPCFAVTAATSPPLGQATKKVFVFGDPRGMVVGMRRTYTFEASDHFEWSSLRRSFRGWGRAGTKIRRAEAFAMLTLTA